MNTKHIFLTLTVVAIMFSSYAYAATTRTFLSKGLAHSYKNPRVTSLGLKDQFTVKASASNKTYRATYQSDDAILIVSLEGGTIKSFEIGNAGEVTILFTSGFSISDGPINLQLFTSSKLEFALNEVGFKEAIAGAWFSSPSTRLTSRPSFTDEEIVQGSGNSIFWTQEYKGQSSKKISVTLNAFFPVSALAYINNGFSLTAEQVVLRQLVSNNWIVPQGASALSKDNGVLFKIPVKLTRKSRSIVLDIAGH